MFGYVRVREDTLPTGAMERYQAVYCGLCHTMGARYGQISRFFLNYDFAFLAMLLAPANAEDSGACRRCPRHLLHGKCACSGGAWLNTAAGESVILTHWKLRDSIEDGAVGERAAARAALLALEPGYRKAKAEFPAFDQTSAQRLSELRALEVARSASIDRTADQFACLLAAAAPKAESEFRQRTMYQLLYHLGRWIYLIDGVDDLTEDDQKGSYNPIRARFPVWSETDRAYLRQMLSHSLTLVGAAFQLLEPNPWYDVLENIIYSGLPTVEEMVFSGQWREYQKHRRIKDD